VPEIAGGSVMEKESLACPRCGKGVQAKNGICPSCGENAL
jgi:ribosomal protein S27AE